MGVTHNTSLVRALRRIAAFLNAMGPGATSTHWEAFLKEVGQLTPEEQAQQDTMRGVIKEWVAEGKLSQAEADAMVWDAPTYWQVTFDEAKKLRGEIDYDLGFLKAAAPPERPLDDLLERLNELKLPMVWRCESLDDRARPADPSAATLSIRWKNGQTKRWTTRSWYFTRGIRAHLYAILGKALENGLLSKLKTCQLCEQYLVVTRATKTFCPPCKNTAGNLNRPKGYHQDRRLRKRAKQLKKARAIQRARKLTLSDASIELLYKETDLPRRVVVAEIFKKKRTGVSAPKTVARAKLVAPQQPVVEGPTIRLMPLRPDPLPVERTLRICPVCQKSRRVPVGVKAICYHREMVKNRETRR
jgi:hypothetical protein